MKKLGKNKRPESAEKKDGKVIDGMSIEEQAYIDLLDEVGHPVACSIKARRVMPEGDFAMLKIQDVKKTVSYMKDDVAVSYKTLTHELSNSESRFGLACSSTGHCELYNIVPDGKAQSKLVMKARVSQKIVDPMFAFTSKNFLYIVFNVPTQVAIDSGVTARKPLFSSDDDIVTASGAPYVLQVNLDNGDAARMGQKFEGMARYAITLANDPKADIPMLLVANVLTTKKVVGEAKPSIKKLIEDFFVPEEDKPKNEKRMRIPVGVSVMHIAKREVFHLVPLAGAAEFEIEAIRILASEDDCNSVGIISDEILEEARADVAELEAILEEAEKVDATSEMCSAPEAEGENEAESL